MCVILYNMTRHNLYIDSSEVDNESELSNISEANHDVQSLSTDCSI